MKGYLLGLIILLSTFSFSQKKYQAKDIIDYDSIIYNIDKETGNEIYRINKPILDKLLKASNKKYTLIYTFGVWCSPCVEKLPKVLDLKKDFNNLTLLITTAEKDYGKYLWWTSNYFRENSYVNFPTFNVFSEFPKKGRSKKYNRFIQEIVPNHKDYGYSLLILIENNTGNVLFASTYNETPDYNFRTIKEYLRH